MTLHSPARSWLLERLSDRHAELEAALAEEMGRPLPDEMALRRIKREKLVLRDRIAAIERSATTPSWLSDPAPQAAALRRQL